MWKQILCLGENKQYTADYREAIKKIAEAGFEATFANYRADLNLYEFSSEVEAAGLILQSVHAPFGRMADIWGEDSEAAEAALRELTDCFDACVNCEVPIMVAHAFIGFKDHTPTEAGLDRLGRLVRRAEGSGVRLAFENTEGIEYLDAIFSEFKDKKTVGFCWDTGHEMCYNRSADLIAKYGDRLACTHLNDNLGIKSFNGEITWLDDLHLLPFDGIADWEYITERLASVGFDGPLTFELNTKSKPGRHENDKYGEMPLERYLSESYSRACRVARLFRSKRTR